MNAQVRSVIFKNPRLIGILLKIHNRLNFQNKTSARGVSFKSKNGAFYLKGVRVVSTGTGNEIFIDDYSRLLQCRIAIYGNNNRIHIGNRCYLNEVNICVEDNGNTIKIGDHTSFAGHTEFAAIEGTTIEVGEDCMFSGEIKVRTGDSHSIINSGGERINASADIFIGNHCWIGTRALILKGSRIGSNCVVAAAALVNKTFFQDNSILAGAPAKIVKEGINWKRERI